MSITKGQELRATSYKRRTQIEFVKRRIKDISSHSIYIFGIHRKSISYEAFFRGTKAIYMEIFNPRKKYKKIYYVKIRAELKIKITVEHVDMSIV